MFQLFVIFTLITNGNIIYGATDKKSIENFIIGGKAIDIGEVPYQVSIQYNESHKCGGSIISKLHILTVAHCAFIGDIRSYTIVYGTSYHKVAVNARHVSAIYGHPKYNRLTLDNDIAIFKVSESIIFNQQVNTINLPIQNEIVSTGTIARITGWGTTAEYNSERADILQYIDVPKINQRDCQRAHSYTVITTNMNCYGILGVGGKDSCYGDSGGPVAINGTLYGMTSWGSGCARPKYPGVYTKVANYVKWIKSIVQRDTISS